MQFTKLRLLGFKSFVDPTELVIAPGLTGVVGPNGCGKSNLLEALRWVMGENRPTAMRGGGMEDVIFAGAASRPARNFAEVTLHLDNADRQAPPTFNENDTVDIVRRITRDVGSAYKANGKDVRARDIQMLFADASTGAHSPALVRQGQISELINAKPKARRRILEEAAGISGLYQRRHEAELKLKGTETNLERVEDVLEQLAGQLRALEKQARQASRYREIAEDLRRAEGLLLYLRWRDTEEERLSAERSLAEATKLAGSGQSDASAAGRARSVAEDKVPPLREEEAIAGAVLQRFIVERDQLASREEQARKAIDALEGRINQLARDAEREAGLKRDADEVIKKLDWEKDALEKASAGHQDALAEAEDAAKLAAASMQQAEADLDRQTEDAARLSARHQSVERRLDEAQTLVARLTSETAQAETAAADVGRDLDAAKEALVGARKAQQDAAKEAEAAEQALADAEAARADRQASETERRAVLSEADGEAKALEAEIAALERLIGRESADGGQLIDDVRADAGFEAALGAALADDLKAPMIAADAASGWVTLAAYNTPAALPKGVAPLASHVTAPDVLARRLTQIGLVDRADGARLQAELLPGQRLVSREGDLWRWDGYRAGAEDAPSAAALRLQQMNRLETLKAAFAEVSGKAQTARAAHEADKQALEAAQTAEQAARTGRRSADEAATSAIRAASRAEADESTLTGRLETLRMALARRQEDGLAAEQALAEAKAAMDDLGDLEVVRGQVEDQKMQVEAARLTMISHRTGADELRREGEARVRRAQEITKEVSGWRHRLETTDTRIAELEARIVESNTELEAARSTPDEIAAKRASLSDDLERAETRLKAASDALATGETALREAEAAERQAERVASEGREVRARAEALFEAAVERVATAAARIDEDHEMSPDALFESLEADPDKLPAADVLDTNVQRLKRQRESLGAVNLRAEEDAREVQEEFDGLSSEKTDLEEAVAKLRSGISSLNREGRERLLAAFDQVNSNFTVLFRHLFGGGEASLVMVESEDPLDAGLEIMCQPPGKKLSTLSLLSGGEQTLTALSLIFAVFLANPSPICVLDEVDAPLDDANVNRFCDLLDEMTKRTETRFLIITHHAVTMARMDRLFGVTMAEQGVSQLVSVDLRKAEELVDA